MTPDSALPSTKLQPRTILARGDGEPAAERAEEIARIGQAEQIGHFQQGQVGLGQFATAIVEKLRSAPSAMIR